MSLAMPADGRTAWVRDQDASAVVYLESMRSLIDFKVSQGCETAVLVA